MSATIYKWDAQQTNKPLQQKHVGVYKWAASFINEAAILINETVLFIYE